MTGRYDHNIDAKGRLFIPAKIRDELGGAFYLAPGIDNCLAIYPQQTWDSFVERASSMPMSQSKRLRILFANTIKCELDAQGRIVIPKKLLQYAALEKEATIIGVDNRAEIWSRDNWEQEDEACMTPEIMSKLMEDLGL